MVRMRDSMVRRGRVGGGIWISSDKKIGLGHRRLSIIGLSQFAKQPMRNEYGALGVIDQPEILAKILTPLGLWPAVSHGPPEAAAA